MAPVTDVTAVLPPDCRSSSAKHGGGHSQRTGFSYTKYRVGQIPAALLGLLKWP
jgi:hypothetical protein